jgi:TetR/AcrR family transcriptional regulator, mexJK operon transcriptional repressor
MPQRTRRPRGRPKDPQRREAILEAAKRLFAEHGYAGVSMEQLAREAGVSKLTLYSHFGGKEELFQEAVAEKCRAFTPPELFERDGHLPLQQRLRNIGMGFTDLVFSDEAIRLYRMMSGNAQRDPRLGKLFFAAGPRRVLDLFTEFLRAADAASELRVADPERAATHFFCLLKGVHHLRVLIGEREAPGRKEMRAHVDEVVEMFLRLFAVDRAREGKKTVGRVSATGA